MSGTYENFEKRFSNNWFSANWSEVDVEKIKEESKARPEILIHKGVETLEQELANLKADMENIIQKQLRLNNLSKLYNGFLTEGAE